jgi:hypothetical protein
LPQAGSRKRRTTNGSISAQCHTIDGRPHDRLLFDLLASEFRDLDEMRLRRIDKAQREAVYE